MLHSAALLTAEESRAADRAAVASGTASEKLMENAARAVIDVIVQKYSPRPTLIVCGTGNNGGDGFAVAYLLQERGWDVTLAVAGNILSIRGDARNTKDNWNAAGGTTRTFTADLLQDQKLVVDAIFGTGLARNVEGMEKEAIIAINNSQLPVVSVDIPSGVNADNGEVMGTAIRAAHTVTFVRPKVGHLLLPGKAHSGELHVYDIGIPGVGIKPAYLLNGPSLWQKSFPFPAPDANKYTRGHALIMGGDMATTGAARLAALAALRSGSGLVSVACTEDALPIYAMTLTAVMTKPYRGSQLHTLLEDPRITAALIGPGHGVSEATRERTLQILAHKKPCVLDADALTTFEKNSAALFSAINGPCVLTPHEGEFGRLFRYEGFKPQRALDAARESKAVIVFKGNDTVIAAPDGRVAINANAPVWLATAGTGDILAGIITGLLAQGMPAFEAACAGVWIQGEAASAFGPGLIAEDLPAMIPTALKKLYA
jgi:NAD(P)H-hydrate epimerase